MFYDFSNPLDAQQARTRLELLIRRQAMAELTERKPKRSLPQNAYLHLLLGYFAACTGNTLEWVKREYYKKLCNLALFVRRRKDPYTGDTPYLRSSAELGKDEMALSIERFRNWSAQEAGIWLPEAASEAEMAALQAEVEKCKAWI